MEILKLYITGKELLNSIDVKEVAKRTNGFNCADLKTLVNETLLQCVSSGKEEIKNKDFYETIPLIAFKGIRKESTKEADNHVIFHEIGHFLCEYALNNNTSLISVEKIGNVAGHVAPYMGYVEDEGIEEDKILSFEQCKNRAIVFLAGFAAEKYFVGQTFTDVQSDLSEFKFIIRIMCCSGMLGSKYLFTTSMERSTSIFGHVLDDTTISNDDIRAKLFDDYLEIATNILDEFKGLAYLLFGELKKNNKLEPNEINKIITEYNKLQEEGAIISFDKDKEQVKIQYK